MSPSLPSRLRRRPDSPRQLAEEFAQGSEAAREFLRLPDGEPRLGEPLGEQSVALSYPEGSSRTVTSRRVVYKDSSGSYQAAAGLEAFRAAGAPDSALFAIRIAEVDAPSVRNALVVMSAGQKISSSGHMSGVTLLFGFLLVACSLLFMLRPEPRYLASLVGLGATTGAAGLLGFCSGMMTTLRYLDQVSAGERFMVVAALLNGDLRTVDTLYARYERQLFGFIRKHLADVHQASTTLTQGAGAPPPKITRRVCPVCSPSACR